jgi:TonB family protein
MVQRDQDAYARSSNNLPAASNTTSRSISQPQISSIEVPGSQSYPVPPSVPLAGVPSGSVGATSELHAIRVPPELQSRSPQPSGNLQIGQLVSSYSPAYPIGAARDGIEGTVKLDVIVARDGTVRSVRVVSGPPMLASSAANAVRDWRYGETFLSGQAIETEQYVTIVFRLAK